MVLLLNEAKVHELLTIDTAISACETALKSISQRSCVNPLRWGMVLPLEEKDGVHVCGHMPCYLPSKTSGDELTQWWHPKEAPEGKKASGGYFASKIVSVFPSNSGTSFSSHQGVVTLFEAEHGSMVMIADAHEITAVRTAASSGE